ncbi:MAG: hypothetical protein ACK4M7_11210 [Burkholderiales bacterium]
MKCFFAIIQQISRGITHAFILVRHPFTPYPFSLPEYNLSNDWQEIGKSLYSHIKR